MKIDILTWFKANNHGAILQTYASQKVLQEMGAEVEIVDYYRKVVSNKSFCKRLKKALKEIISTEILNRKKIKSFDIEKKNKMNKFIKNNFRVVTQKSGKYDYLMIGSDMVFSFEQGYNPYMFGIGLNYSNIFSYAACSGGSTIEKVKDYDVTEEVNKALNHFSGIGCRDKMTESFVYSISGRKDTIENIDPVLLYGFDKEKIQWSSGKWKNCTPYVLIYAYHENLNHKKEYTQILKYAEENRCKTISVGFYHKWCDENVNVSPEEFLDLFNYASYVFTDTFHGTIFSMINNKNFVTIIRGNAYKVYDLLIKCGLESRIADIESIYEKTQIDVDYSKYEDWINIERQKSKKYIMNQIGIDHE